MKRLMQKLLAARVRRRPGRPRNYGEDFVYHQPLSDSGAIPEEFEPVMVG